VATPSALTNSAPRSTWSVGRATVDLHRAHPLSASAECAVPVHDRTERSLVARSAMCYEGDAVLPTTPATRGIVLTHEQNELLTRVEGDAPMGRLMRSTLDPAPLRASRPMARRSVASSAPTTSPSRQRRSRGLSPKCPHRGCSLVLARNEL
jgi:hypothetical protein